MVVLPEQASVSFACLYPCIGRVVRGRKRNAEARPDLKVGDDDAAARRGGGPVRFVVMPSGPKLLYVCL